MSITKDWRQTICSLFSYLRRFATLLQKCRLTAYRNGTHRDTATPRAVNFLFFRQAAYEMIIINKVIFILKKHINKYFDHREISSKINMPTKPQNSFRVVTGLKMRIAFQRLWSDYTDIGCFPTGPAMRHGHAGTFLKLGNALLFYCRRSEKRRYDMTLALRLAGDAQREAAIEKCLYNIKVTERHGFFWLGLFLRHWPWEAEAIAAPRFILRRFGGSW